MKILVVDDEEKLAEYLRKGLTEEGFAVDVAHNGIDGLHLYTLNKSQQTIQVLQGLS